MKYCFGIDIGGTTVKIGLFSEEARLLSHWQIPTRKGDRPLPLLLDIKASLEECLSQREISKEDILGIGMAAPGPVGEDGILQGTVNIGWGDVPLGQEAEEILGISPVAVGNDASVAALGEAFFGAGRGAKSLLMVTLGTGVGGGVVLDGRMLTGFDGAAGEIGHMMIDLQETEPCNCGKKGCLEQYASATGMVRVAQRFLKERQEPSVLRQAAELTAKDICNGAKTGDKLSLEVMDFVCERLGLALANASGIVDPEMFVIGGGVSAAGEFLLERVEKAFLEYVFPRHRKKRFALAALGNDAGIQGAAVLALQQMKEGNREK